MKHLLEHFKDLSIHPKNAAELKGLILQLAVQGKLTSKWREENSDVESSSVLLERIQAEKTQLIKEKKIKKEKPLPKIEEKEIRFEAPNSWEWCRLGEITDIIAGASFKSGDFNNIGGTKCIKITNAGVREFVETNDYLPKNFVELYPNYLIRQGDLILALTRPYIKDGLKISICPSSYHNSLLNQRVASIRSLTNNIFLVYIFSFIQSPDVLNFYKSKFDGKSQQPNMKMGDITELVISLPPLEEQKAIVKIVNTLFAEVEQLESLTKERIQLKETFATSALKRLSEMPASGVQTHGRASQQAINGEWAFLQQHFATFFTEQFNIKKLRESILQLAVQGKLTTHWRSRHPELVSGSNSAEELLQRIKAEKAQLVKEKKIKKEKLLPEITADEIPYELPEGWVWCRIGEILNVKSSKRVFKSDYVAEGVPFFRSKEVGQLGRGEEVSTELFISRERFEEFKKNFGTTKAGDVLMACIGGSIGNTWLVDEREFYYKDGNLVQLDSIPQIDNFFLLKYLDSKTFYDSALGRVSGSAYNALTIEKIKNSLFPLPSEDEQQAIVEKVNTLMALCDRLEQEIQNSKATQEDWMKSSLREVFAVKN